MNQDGQNDHKITRLLFKCSKGNQAVFDELLLLIYDELHQPAARNRNF